MSNRKLNNASRLSTGIILGISVLVLVYTGYRAANLSMTHDESYSYSKYVHYTYFQIAQYRTDNISPNNHILNTFAQKFFSEIFGPSELAIRLGSLISCAVFLLAALLISRFFTGIYMLVAFFILTLNPYVLDFMMLSRGYGMAISFMLLSVYFMILSIRHDFKPGYCALGLFSAFLSVLANFAWLNYFIIQCLVFLVLQIVWMKGSAEQRRRYQIFRVIGLMSLSTFLLLLSIYRPLKMILERKLLYGGEEGFWSDTVRSLCAQTAYGADYISSWMIFLQGLIILAGIASSLQVVYIIKTRKPNQDDLILIFLLLLNLGMVLVTIAQHYFMGSWYPQERTATTFIMPFLVLMLFSMKSILHEHGRKFPLLKLTPVLIAGIFTAHMLNSFNLTYVIEWKYDANTKEIAQDIEELDGEVALGAHPLYVYALNFYRQTKHLTKFEEIHSDGYRLKGEYTHFVIPPEDRQKIADENLEIIKEYHPSLAILAKRPLE